jgi:hypothetical protein
MDVLASDPLIIELEFQKTLSTKRREPTRSFVSVISCDFVDFSYRRQLNSVETLKDIARGEAKDYWTAMGAGGWGRGF